MTPQLRRLRDDELSLLVQKATADDHAVLFPTHVVEKNGQICGYLSIGAIPVVNVWMSTKELNARDSVAVLGQLNAVMDHAGAGTYFMPCSPDSPYYELMDKMGYVAAQEVTMFLKGG